MCCLLPEILSRKYRAEMTHLLCEVPVRNVTDLPVCLHPSSRAVKSSGHRHQRPCPTAPALVSRLLSACRDSPSRKLLLIVSWFSSLTSDLNCGLVTPQIQKKKEKKNPCFELFHSRYMRQTKIRERDTAGKGIFLSLGLRRFVAWLFHHSKMWNCTPQ